jgi:small subunit ribosomal protein SAe
MSAADREAAIKLMLGAKVHIGSSNASFGMTPYVFSRAKNGTHIINLGMTWEKIKFAARMIHAVDEPRDVLAISGKPFGHRAVHKFSQFLGALCINQRFTPGYFTNHSIKGKFMEPRLIVVCDPNFDTQAIREASYANIPCIALCDTDANLEYVDCVIPCNTKNKMAIDLVMWLLTREVLRLRGTLLRAQEWNVLPDLFFYRDAIDEEKIKEDMENQNTEVAEQEGQSSAAVPVAVLPAADPNNHASEREWDEAGDSKKNWGL